MPKRSAPESACCPCKPDMQLAGRCLRWLLTALGVGLAGCGNSGPPSLMHLYPAKGKVLLADGKPLTAGYVRFMGTKSQVISLAPIESNGGFTFKGPSGDNALPEDEYRVVIEPAPGAPDKRSGAKAELPFASKYTDYDASDLQAVVTTDESKNNYELKLDPKDKADPSSKPGRLGGKRPNRN